MVFLSILCILIIYLYCVFVHALHINHIFILCFCHTLYINQICVWCLAHTLYINEINHISEYSVSALYVNYINVRCLYPYSVF